MPTTPEIWLDSFQVSGLAAGTETDSSIVQLANGNILVVWTAYNGTDYDILGQIYDPFGAAVGSQLNLATTSNTEDFGDVAATTDGGFVITYERDTGSFDDIAIQQFDSAGAPTTSTFFPFFDGTSSGAPDGFTPEIAVSSATSALVIWRETDSGGDSAIMGQIYNPTTGALVGSPISIIAYPGTNTWPDVTALNNGNYVIVDSHTASGSTDSRIVVRILDAAGNNVAAVNPIDVTDGDGDQDYDPSVTALTGGGFVVTWRNVDSSDSDIMYQVFSSTGTEVGTSRFVGNGGATDTDNEPVVVAMDDGGFIVLWDDDETGLQAVRGQRFNSSGNAVGINFVVETGASPSQIDATLMADGRVAISYTSGSEIFVQIIDTRDNGSEGDMPLSGNDFDYWVGTAGNDTFTVDSGDGDVRGHTGNDDITESGAVRNYYGDEGNDTIRVTSSINSDLHDGGSGIDLIDWSGSGASSATFDLGAGTATQGGQTEVMTGFENLNGTNNGDIIIGSSVNNVINGGDGNDTIRDDSGTSAGDTVNGEDGDDVLEILGGPWAAHFNGGNGTDTLDLSGWTESSLGFIVDLGGDFYDYRYVSTGLAYGNPFDLFSVENIIGSDFADEMDAGGEVGVTLMGGDGDDTLTGGLNNQTIEGGDGNDVIDGGFAAGSGVADSLSGGNGDDTITGAGGGDTIEGGDGADSMSGNGGNDTMSGGAQNDQMFGGDGDDEMNGGLGSDSMEGGTGNDLMVGGNRGDTIKGDGGNDTIGAGNGDDEVDGGTGDDLVRGGDGDDYVLGGGQNDTLLGGVGVDTLIGGNGNDTIKGRGGFDILNGGAGNDLMTGGNQADQFVFTNGFGNDVITDFNATNDAEDIDLSGVSSIVNFTDLMNNHISQVGADVYIDDLNGNTIRLIGVNLGDLNNADFDF